MKSFLELRISIKESSKPKTTLIRHRNPDLILKKSSDYIEKIPIIKKIYASSMIGKKSPITISPIKNVVAQKQESSNENF